MAVARSPGQPQVAQRVLATYSINEIWNVLGPKLEMSSPLRT